MKYLPNLLLVIGVCVSSLGASGFHAPYPTNAGEASTDQPSTDQPSTESPGASASTREPYALALFLAGCVTLTAGGLLTRQARRAGPVGATTRQEELEFFTRNIEAIRAAVVQMEEGRDLSPAEVHGRIDRLMAEEYFDLTSRCDDLVRLIGFRDYARVWEGVAIAERLLNRSWSMITDGYPEEGLAELALARKGIEQAAEAMASL